MGAWWPSTSTGGEPDQEQVITRRHGSGVGRRRQAGVRSGQLRFADHALPRGACFLEFRAQTGNCPAPSVHDTSAPLGMSSSHRGDLIQNDPASATCNLDQSGR